MQSLELEIKQLIISTLALEDLTPDAIDAAAPLFGEGLGLDSIDALELGLALQKRYGVTLSADSQETRQHFSSVNALARPFRRYRADYRFLPRVTYTDPEVASVGLSEDSARAQSVSFEVTRYNLDDFERAIADGETEGFVKILTQSGNDKLLGVTIVAPHAGEMIAEWVLAMRQGLRLRHVMQAIHSYPTWSEANKMAAGRCGLARQPERLQRLAKRWFDWVRG